MRFVGATVAAFAFVCALVRGVVDRVLAVDLAGDSVWSTLRVETGDVSVSGSCDLRERDLAGVTLVVAPEGTLFSGWVSVFFG